MTLEQSLVADLNTALNEADVCGLRYEPDKNEARLLIEVLALPLEGPVDPDPRRALVLGGATSILVWLERDRVDVDGEGAAVPIASLEALEEFFVSLRWAHSMYGWEFIDLDDPRRGFPSEPSLAIATGVRPAPHSLRWFTECGREEASGQAAYVLGGVVWFDTFHVERADGVALDPEAFAAAGTRWWKAFYDKDPRISVEAQREHSAQALHWRTRSEYRSARVPGGPASGRGPEKAR